MNKIENFQYNLLSNIDDFGRVFIYENKVMRGIYPEKVDCVKKMFSSGLIDALYSEKFIPYTVISEYYADEFPMILEHERISTVSYFTEWTFDMIRDAGLFVLSLERYLNNNGWKLKDCHPYNILFNDSGDCVYVDIGSIIPWDGKHGSFLREFDAFYIYPVEMYRYYPDLASKMLRRSHNWSFDELLVFYNGFSRTCYNKGKILLQKLIYRVASRNFMVNRFLLDKRKKVLTSAAILGNGVWSDYQNEEVLQQIFEYKEIDDFVIKRFERYKMILTYLLEMQPSSVFEFGANSGLFAVAACKFCYTIKSYIATDYDNKAINYLYLFVKKNKLQYDFLSKIKSFVIDFAGLYKHQNWQDMNERFRSDVVICMAMTHHLLLKQGISIDMVLRQLRAVSRKYVIVEFMPLGLWGGTNVLPIVPDWYTLEYFEKCMSKYFLITHIDKLEQNRILLIGLVREECL